MDLIFFRYYFFKRILLFVPNSVLQAKFNVCYFQRIQNISPQTILSPPPTSRILNHLTIRMPSLIFGLNSGAITRHLWTNDRSATKWFDSSKKNQIILVTMFWKNLNATVPKLSTRSLKKTMRCFFSKHYQINLLRSRYQSRIKSKTRTQMMVHKSSFCVGVNFQGCVLGNLRLILIITFAAHGAKKKRTLKIPILTTSDTYFTSVKEDTSHLYDPITYTPTALEVFNLIIIFYHSIISCNIC